MQSLDDIINRLKQRLPNIDELSTEELRETVADCATINLSLQAKIAMQDERILSLLKELNELHELRGLLQSGVASVVIQKTNNQA